MKGKIKVEPFALPTPVYMVGSYDENGNPNVMNAAWGGVCSSTPPCIAVSIREKRQTYKNILNHKCFTISIPTAEYVIEADYFGIASGSKANKFEISKLTPAKGKVVNAPYVEEFPINIECKVVNIIEIGSHFQVIGEIVNILGDKDKFKSDGTFNFDKINPLMFNPITDEYHGTGEKVGKAFNIGLKYIKK